MSETPDETIGIWSAVGNVVQERLYGPGQKNISPGTKHFKAGAKVYVIDAYWGNCESVTVVGHHRKSNRYIKIDMRARDIENLRVKLVYEPKVQELIREHFGNRKSDKINAENICSSLPLWPK